MGGGGSWWGARGAAPAPVLGASQAWVTQLCLIIEGTDTNGSRLHTLSASGMQQGQVPPFATARRPQRHLQQAVLQHPGAHAQVDQLRAEALDCLLEGCKAARVPQGSTALLQGSRCCCHLLCCTLQHARAVCRRTWVVAMSCDSSAAADSWAQRPASRALPSPSCAAAY